LGSGVGKWKINCPVTSRLYCVSESPSVYTNRRLFILSLTLRTRFCVWMNVSVHAVSLLAIYSEWPANDGRHPLLTVTNPKHSCTKVQSYKDVQSLKGTKGTKVQSYKGTNLSAEGLENTFFDTPPTPGLYWNMVLSDNLWRTRKPRTHEMTQIPSVTCLAVGQRESGTVKHH
jgi:hypothetical protein